MTDDENNIIVPADNLFSVKSDGGDAVKEDDFVNKIKEVLDNHSIGYEEVREILSGPTISTIGIKPLKQTKIKDIVDLSNDFAFAMKVHPIRIDVVVPGTDYIGIQIPENSYRNTGRINQAITSYYLSPITDYELNTPIHPYQIRNQITSGLLHEILHLYGMSDKNGGGKYDFYEGEIYDGNQIFDDNLKNSITEQSRIGRFHKIDNSIANEIGWCDENDNGIFDANEYFVK